VCVSQLRPCLRSSRGRELCWAVCGSGEAEEVSPHGCRIGDRKWLGLDAFSIHPGDGHPLWRAAGLLKGFLQQLEAFFHPIVDQREVEVVCVSALDAL